MQMSDEPTVDNEAAADQNHPLLGQRVVGGDRPRERRPPRQSDVGYVRPPIGEQTFIPEIY